MLKETQTNQYEVGTQFVFGEGDPTPTNVVLEGLGRAVEAVKLEARMIIFDAVHGTDYRRIRHELVEQQKRQAFEESIGIVAIGRK